MVPTASPVPVVEDGNDQRKTPTCPLPSPFAQPLLFPTTPLAVRACAKGGKWAVLKRFRAVFFKPFPPRVHTLSTSQTQKPLGSLSVLASRYTPIDGHRVHAFDPCDVAVREPVVVHDGPLRIAECELGLACHTGR